MRYESSSRLRSRLAGWTRCVTDSAAALFRATCTKTGSRRNESARTRISPVSVAEKPPGGGHQELYALAKRRGLRLHVDAAEYHGTAQADVLAVDAHALFDLRGELAGGREDQGPHRMPRRGGAGVGVSREALQQRQREARGLAGSGLGAAHDVASLQNQRNRLRLDRRRLGIALLRNCFQQLG